MADNQFLKIQDVYDPVDTANEVLDLQDKQIRNRVDAMKAKQAFQAMKRKEAWAAAANNPQWLSQIIGGQLGGQTMPPNGQNPAGMAPNSSVQPQPGQGQPVSPTAQGMPQNPPPQGAPGQPMPQGQPAPQLSEEDKSAMRGQKVAMGISRQVSSLLPQAKKDSAARERINKATDQLENNPDYQAFVKKAGFDEMKFSVDKDTGDQLTTLTKNWTGDALNGIADKIPNGESLRPFAQFPGKYRLQFQENGVLVGAEFLGGGAKTLPDKELTAEQRLLRSAKSQELGRPINDEELYNFEQDKKSKLLEDAARRRQNVFSGRAVHAYNTQTGITTTMSLGALEKINAKNPDKPVLVDMTDPTVATNVKALKGDVAKYDLMTQSESAAFAASKLLQESSKNYKRGKIAFVNNLQSLAKGAANDPALADFQMKLMAFGREYYKVVNNAYASVSELSQGAREQADQMLSTSNSWESLEAKIKAAQQEMINSKLKLKKVITGRQENLKNMTLTGGQELSPDELQVMTAGQMEDEQLLKNLEAQ